MRASTWLTAFTATLALATAAQAAPNDRPPKCFSTQFFDTWKAPDEHTMYIKVGTHDFYRVDLANRCSALKGFDPHLITIWRGSNWVCNALDWDLKVSRGRGSPGEPCIVKAMTPLTRAEADAIPRKFRP
ncbi:MAG: hypothetical protein ISS15_05690 [Alphaproteobacteria bacterium]|nr:hypothetical protein [Alphaproteobacteria bacterium]MBL6939387.1 hypothetical protein [Alphaproteobacteria bacterium]MBL7097132.1 hypothetical protein [Alphaproteobacteria bacterium]